VTAHPPSLSWWSPALQIDQTAGDRGGQRACRTSGVASASPRTANPTCSAATSGDGDALTRPSARFGEQLEARRGRDRRARAPPAPPPRLPAALPAQLRRQARHLFGIRRLQSTSTGET
jgi:hypothetical protein